MASSTTEVTATDTLDERRLDLLARIEQRVLWLAVRIVDYANREQIVDVPTIGPADTFMPMGSANPSFNLTAIRPVNREIRNRIAQVAESKLGSQNWLARSTQP